jgi:ornithine cyclodeaminase
MTILTALRTAATSAVAARYMATPGSTTMGLIGTGAQAEFQTLAFAYLMGVKAIRYFDVDPYAMEKFEHNLRDTPLTLIRCSSPEETIDGVRLITTATAAKRHQVLFPGVLVSAGAHLNAIGGDCPGKTELDPTLLSRARTVVEYLPQSRIEGEIQQCRDSGHVVELWEVVSGIKPGRVSDDEITIFDSVGFALEDFATLRYVQRMCQETGISVSCPLVPKPRDPRNLFGYIFGNSFSERHPT